MSIEIGESRARVTAGEGVAAPRQGTWLSSLWSDLRLLLIALWLGAALFSLVVAQGAFAVLPTRELAGAVVGFTLAFLNTSGFIISALLLVSSFFKQNTTTPRARMVAAISLAVVALATGVGQWVITARLRAIRAAMARPVDELAKDDPLRVAFGSLHGYSVLVLLLAMLAAAVAFFAIARGSRAVQSPMSKVQSRDVAI
ncbi:MAG: DUF4149 domain-containing protein [Acidobacteriota bacterium]|nr:DUF4149 domain-containing protein [Acidobacteriota bacterium]